MEDGVAVITINVPEKMNTMGGHVNHGVLVGLDLAAEDPDVSVVVFTGAGVRAFCAGGDLASGSLSPPLSLPLSPSSSSSFSLFAL